MLTIPASQYTDMSQLHREIDQRLDHAWFGARTDAELITLRDQPGSARHLGILMPIENVSASAIVEIECRARKREHELERRHRKHEWYRTFAMFASALLVALTTIFFGG